MDIEKYLEDILSEVNGQSAWNWVAKISQFSRIQASDGYHEVAEIIKNELLRIGYSEVEHFYSPADGKNNIWGYIAAYQWEIETGELWIIEPERMKLCDYNEIQTSIITHSTSCDVITEVVDIGKGDKKEDYENKDLDGKIIMISSPTYMYHPFVESSRALGVIYYPDLERAGEQINKRIYNSFFTTYDRLENAKFGFSVSYKQAIYLKELLNKGSVKVHAKIDAKFNEGNLEVISTAIQGIKYPEQEIIVIAHLCHPHPGANDNASGAAGLLELARVLKYQIDEKIINTPKRTIRFVWVPEFNGTVPWMKHHEKKIKNVLTCLNLDMIGEHRHKLGYPLEVTMAPYSTPSAINDIATFFVEKIVDHPKGVDYNGSKVPMSYRLTSFEGGSDHVLFSDSFFGIPSLMFGHEDPNWHTSIDTVEYCDSTELKRVIGMALSISHTLSILDENLIIELWPIIHQGFYYRWGKTIRIIDEIAKDIALQIITLNKEELEELIMLGQDIINAIYDYELNIFKWLERIDSTSKIMALVESAKNEVEEVIKSHQSRWNEQIKNYCKEIESFDSKFAARYKPNYIGPFVYDELTILQRNQLFKDFSKELNSKSSGPIIETINLVSKGYNILRVSSLLSLEYNVVISPRKVMELVNYLEKEKLVQKI
ncbi:MAG: DUF4910 domain-containing protein [Candidatus Heimdallarchaeota archaeon]